MNQEQTNITTGKQIRHLRTQLGMTQEELAGELNVTRQALSNWERDVNEPDLNMLKKICFLFGVNMDDFAKEVITKMETYEKKEKRQFNKYDMAIGLFLWVRSRGVSPTSEGKCFSSSAKRTARFMSSVPAVQKSSIAQ